VNSSSVHLALGFALLLAAGAIRAFTPNRLVRRKLRLSIYIAIAAVLGAAAEAFGRLDPALAGRLQTLLGLLFALGIIAFLVVVTINPLRVDRIPARFPNILQDALIVGLFLIVATALMEEKFFTTSAVGAVVIGFALQDTLGNAFAGLAIQTEKPFHVGQWIRVGDHEGCVEEITWRATRLRTKANAFVIVPNSLMSREAIVNYSEPVIPTRIFVEVGATYLAPPNEVKAAIHEAIANAPLALKDPAPDVLLVDFGNSAITYRARFWVEDFARDIVAQDQVRTNIYYTFRRRGIEIPWPIQVEYSRVEPPARGADLTERFARCIADVDIFSSLGVEERRELAEASSERLYAAGESVVRQGDPGASMFVVTSGRVRVTLLPDGRELARLEPGTFFGEMSLLTGEPRSANVAADGDCVLMEITTDAFRRFVIDKPDVLERIGQAVASRRAELERSRAIGETTMTREPATTFLARVRLFLRLPH
jgi:small-conductance mechanosensitive channel/CRP-like cAMP-binding protein